jgi:hypothetical protein
LKRIIYIAILLLAADFSVAQSFHEVNRKGDFWLGWGWNRSAYAKSDIHFTGPGYDFTLHKVVANDRQTPFNAEVYFGFSTITIPQTNLRLGYFVKDNLCVTLGVDHMKYVMSNNQSVGFSGKIDDPVYASYVGSDGTVFLDPDFLTFEHTDGLNYVNAEVEYHTGLYKKNKLGINAYGGGGCGVLVPRSNVKLMGYPRNDEFHLAGYGVDAKLGLEILLGRFFFLRMEGKSGLINMPDIVTRSESAEDRAKQNFGYVEVDGMFGFILAGKSQKETLIN